MPRPKLGGRKKRRPVTIPKEKDWSRWRVLATEVKWFDLERSEVPAKPGCYQLGVSPPEMGKPRWILYVGSAGERRGNLQSRLYLHGLGSDLKKRMDTFLRKGYWVHYRFVVTDSERKARSLETVLRNRAWWLYRWNIQGVPPDLFS